MTHEPPTRPIRNRPVVLAGLAGIVLIAVIDALTDLGWILFAGVPLVFVTSRRGFEDSMGQAVRTSVVVGILIALVILFVP